MSLDKRVTQLRKERKLSRTKLASDAGLSYAFVQQLETGVRKDPGVSNVIKLAAVLGVTVDSLLSDVDDENQSAADSSPMADRPIPARVEIDRLLDGLSADQLVAIRDLLRVWAKSVDASVTERV